MENTQMIEEAPYNESELKHITKILCEAVDPEHVILFGSLAGGTPHSELMTYDLLIITATTPRYDWEEIRHFLKQQLSHRHRGLTSTNIYIYSQHFVSTSRYPFLYLARHEGKLLYSRDSQSFNRSKASFNYAEVYRNSSNYFATFFELGSNLLKESNRCFEDYNLRQSAFCVSHAIELFYRTLFYVYHGFELECSNLVQLRLRMRSLSIGLSLLFDSEDSLNGRLLYRINHYRKDSYYSVNFEVTKEELLLSLTKIGRMKEIVEKICKQRLELYRNRIVE